MTTARSITRSVVQHIGIRDSMEAATQCMRQLGVGAQPICDGEGHPVGIIADRDIVVRVLGAGANPKTTMAGKWRRAPTSCTPSTSAPNSQMSSR